jgi:hypothetical protein
MAEKWGSLEWKKAEYWADLMVDNSVNKKVVKMALQVAVYWADCWGFLMACQRVDWRVEKLAG